LIFEGNNENESPPVPSEDLSCST